MKNLKILMALMTLTWLAACGAGLPNDVAVTGSEEISAVTEIPALPDPVATEPKGEIAEETTDQAGPETDHPVLQAPVFDGTLKTAAELDDSCEGELCFLPICTKLPGGCN